MTTDERVLKCYTDKIGCCKVTDGGGEGEWQFPNGSDVKRMDFNHYFYRDRYANIVRLNWRNDIDTMIPSGIYCCIIPGVIQMACVGVYPDNNGKNIIFLE